MAWEKNLYGDRIAEVYDDFYSDRFDTAGAVEFLGDKARGGRALELAIGTGRVALPLRNTGVEVAGIDISERMV
ncbi:MAG TPA: SAM-dependent methyltransferase, partial [Actinomycetota bacterium]|nr:SAM-dependent methyltransferase [Actinomycetota bacterium]